MGTAVHCIDAVGKTENGFAETVVVLQCDIHTDAVVGFRNVNRLFVQHDTVVVHMAHETSQAALKIEGLFFVVINID